MCASDPRHGRYLTASAISEEECPPRKSMSKCSTFRTRTLLTSLNGSQTTSSQLSAISHQRVSRCQLPSLVTPPPSKRCSRELENNSPACSEERLSSIGIPEKAWTRWSPPKTRKRWTKKKWNDHHYNVSYFIFRFIL